MSAVFSGLANVIADSVPQNVVSVDSMRVGAPLVMAGTFLLYLIIASWKWGRREQALLDALTAINAKLDAKEEKRDLVCSAHKDRMDGIEKRVDGIERRVEKLESKGK